MLSTNVYCICTNIRLKHISWLFLLLHHGLTTELPTWRHDWTSLRLLGGINPLTSTMKAVWWMLAYHRVQLYKGWVLDYHSNTVLVQWMLVCNKVHVYQEWTPVCQRVQLFYQYNKNVLVQWHSTAVPVYWILACPHNTRFLVFQRVTNACDNICHLLKCSTQITCIINASMPQSIWLYIWRTQQTQRKKSLQRVKVTFTLWNNFSPLE